jgi:hypothetical protein
VASCLDYGKLRASGVWRHSRRNGESPLFDFTFPTHVLSFSLLQWPYTYDSCDIGTVANQSLNGLPVAATLGGDSYFDGALSYLPGQKLSRCTCADDLSHPGPKHSDGTWVGRGAPEIDVFEAQVMGDPLGGLVSQSAQWAVSSSLTIHVLYVQREISLSTIDTHGSTRARTS